MLQPNSFWLDDFETFVSGRTSKAKVQELVRLLNNNATFSNCNYSFPFGFLGRNKRKRMYCREVASKFFHGNNSLVRKMIRMGSQQTYKCNDVQQYIHVDHFVCLQFSRTIHVPGKKVEGKVRWRKLRNFIDSEYHSIDGHFRH